MTLTAIVRGWIMLKNDIISERREYVRNQILKSKFCGVHLNKGVTKQYTKIKRNLQGKRRLSREDGLGSAG